MNLHLVIAIISSLVCVSRAVETDKPTEVESPGLRRSGRNYDKYFKSPKNNYGDDSADDDDGDDDYQPDPNNGQPPQGYNGYKGYAQYNYPPMVPSYKGYPYYPSFKGGFKFPSLPGQVDTSALSPDQFVSMMNAIKPDDNKDEDGGFLSKLVSDPKSLTAAALVPLSLVLASVVPVLMNYMMTGMSSTGAQVISTTANNKEGRGLDVSHNLDMVLENIAEFARAMDTDECFQKAICRVASGDAPVPGSEYIKKAATAVAHLVKDDWVNSVAIKDILYGVKEGNCDNVCNSAKLTPRNRK